MTTLILIVYILALAFIFLYSLSQLDLTFRYLKSKKRKVKRAKSPIEYPKVTVQLPIYNELYVVERLIDAVATFDYPIEKLNIQILDDSTDETVDIIAHKVTQWQSKGIDIQHIQRSKRTGFKAGALDYGLKLTDAAFVAIFDADFIPKKDFLKTTIPEFQDDEIGLVQARWGHLNRNYSTLTQMQAFGLDAHFSIEQVGRSQAGSFINFNGTGGVWRVQCIHDAGGWSQDTLTEDLDLSYRAQLFGYKFKYLEEIEAPAELPILMTAIKSQQYRWNKGAAENVRKNLIKVITSNKVSLGNKIHAFFHLANSSVFIGLLIAAILSVPVMKIKHDNPELAILFYFALIFFFGFFSIGFFYFVAVKNIQKEKSLGYFVKTFPTFLTISMGLSLHNGIAVIEGLLGKKSPFIRTPKFAIKDIDKNKAKTEKKKNNIYIETKLPLATYIEGLLCLYFLGGIVLQFIYLDFGMLIFHLMLFIGFGIVFYQTVKAVNIANQ